MTLIVEDGTGRADADALISLAAADAYHTALGRSDWVAGEEGAREAAIRRATAYLSRGYGWAGVRTRGRLQALAWPRSNVVDAERVGIRSDEIPIEVRDACAELARQELASPGSLDPVVTPSDGLVKREQVGPISTEYDLPSTGVEARRPALLAVRDMLAPFLAAAGRAGGVVGTVYRT